MDSAGTVLAVVSGHSIGVYDTAASPDRTGTLFLCPLRTFAAAVTYDDGPGDVDVNGDDGPGDVDVDIEVDGDDAGASSASVLSSGSSSVVAAYGSASAGASSAAVLSSGSVSVIEGNETAGSGGIVHDAGAAVVGGSPDSGGTVGGAEAVDTVVAIVVVIGAADGGVADTLVASNGIPDSGNTVGGAGVVDRASASAVNLCELGQSNLAG